MYYLYNWSVDALGASHAGLLLYLQTAFVALLAYLFLGEGLHAYDLAGAAIIVAGLVIAMTMKPKAGAGPRIRRGTHEPAQRRLLRLLRP